MIAACGQYQKADYTDESWAVFEEAFETAKRTAENPNAALSEIQKAIDELQRAMDGLVKIRQGLWTAWAPDSGLTAPENSEGNYHTAYTGKALKPAILVYDGRTLLKEKTDYTVSYKDNTNAGPATVTVKGKGNYSDSITATFDIDAIHIATLDIADMYAAVASNNTKQVPLKPVVKFNGKTLKVKKDYTAAYKDPDGGKTPGTPSKDYEVLISAVSDNFTGSKTIKMTLVDKENACLMSKASISKIAKADMAYTGEVLKPQITVKYGKNTLAKDTDYTIIYDEEHTEAGETATITVRGNGTTYFGEKTTSFKITAYDITNTDAKFIFNKDVEVPYAKGGSKLTDDQFGAVFQTEDAAVLNLKQGADYTLNYKNNKKADTTASVTVKGKGNFKGTIKDISFKIVQQDLSALEHTTIAADVLEKNAAKYNKVIPAITDLDGKVLKNKTDFEIDAATAYTDKDDKPMNTTPSVGDLIKVTATGKGNYKGTVSAKFYIIGNAMSIAKAAVTVDPQQYIGSEVTLEKNQILVKLKINGTMTALKDSDFEIVGYSKNIKKGTAKVTIRGKYPYGGTKTVNFKIIARPLQKK